MPDYQRPEEVYFPMPAYFEPWAQTERARIRARACGITHIPWIDPRVLGGDFRVISGHYPHVDTYDDPAMITYTPTNKMGRQGQRASMRPGRYLRKYYPRLSDHKIEQMVSEWKAIFTVGLSFADTAEDIAEVYHNGPGSCMSGYELDIDGHHPAEVYGAGDLAVAFITRKGRITARCLTWPDKKIYSVSAYGDATTIRCALANVGFSTPTKDKSFDGAKLLRIDTSRGILCPYVDVAGSVTVTNNALYLGCQDEKYPDSYIEDTGSQHGTLGDDDGYQCAECYEHVDEDYACCYEGETYCEYCFAEIFGCCDGCSESTPHDDLTAVGNCNHYCNSCLPDHAICCYSCDEYEAYDNAVVTKDGDAYCDSCAATETGYCGECYETFPMDEMDDVNAASLTCEDCAAEKKEVDA